MAEKNKSMDDVKDAGKVAQSATSRPVVVGNSNEVVDSTIVEKSKKVIAPLSEEEKKATQDSDDLQEPEKESGPEKVEVQIDPPKTEEESKSPDEEKEASELEKPEDKKEEVSEDKKEESAEVANSEDGSAEVDALAGEVDAKRKEELANKEREDKLQKLEEKIDSKEYFLPIKDSATSSKLGTVLAILILVVGLVLCAGYYYMTTQQ